MSSSSPSPETLHLPLPALLLAFASLWWLLPRLLAFAARRIAASPLLVGTPSTVESSLLEELRANRVERRGLPNMEKNFVAIAKLDRRANRLRAELRPALEARESRVAVAGTVAGLAARALSNIAAGVFIYKSAGLPVLRSDHLADWFAPFHWLLCLGGSGEYLSSASLMLLCLGTVSLASGLARCGGQGDSGKSSNSSSLSSTSASAAFEKFVAQQASRQGGTDGLMVDEEPLD